MNRDTRTEETMTMATADTRGPKLLGCAALLGAALTLPGQAAAIEGNGSSKILGVDNVLSGVMPPPGLRAVLVAASFSAGEAMDGSGRPRAGLSNFELEISVLALRLQYVWPDFKLAGAQVETRLAGGFWGRMKTAFDLATPAGTVHRQDRAEGLGDMLFAPVVLGWKEPTLHQLAGVQLYLGTARWDRTRLANVGRGQHAAGALYGVTWFATPRTELSLGTHVVYNLRNRETGYHSGRELHLDFGTAYAVAPGWWLGLAGYHFQQLGDDRRDGVAVAGGNRGRALALGPTLRVSTNPRWGLIVKWTPEASTRNRGRGDRFMLNLGRQLDG